MASETKGRAAVDLLLGGLQVLVGIIILGHTVTATALSLLFVGWLLLATGIFIVFLAVFQIGKDGIWTALLGGGLMTVLGLLFLRHTGAAALTVTLAAGSLFLVVGIARLAASFQDPEHRWSLVFGGAVSAVLGLIILFNIVAATFTLLGVLLGVQVVTEGLMTMVFGREAKRFAAASPSDTEASTAPA
ncbi:Uncharacterized membrane protein HdeD, DUF308 family [Nocardioides alpinus]|uniref:Sulfate permease n=1 Tax=Nocardioides alpinus TaxID=748909 RepID=A0A1I1AVQ2_9ACTN|nr:DUF308 domain-containing protein [Nocardioides alpinus]PKH40933.1 sulfate permease [Nocardioides alpinus]SFB42159.1 Uncharacterized membrane protein HdeD, DUF308 family [Nocardioides alpinus]